MTLIADDVSADKMQVVNFHPGMIYTSELEREGIPEHGVFEFDDRKYSRSLRVRRGELTQSQRTYRVLLRCGLHLQRRSTCMGVMCTRRGTSKS